MALIKSQKVVMVSIWISKFEYDGGNVMNKLKGAGLGGRRGGVL